MRVHLGVGVVAVETAVTSNLDGNDAPPFKYEMTSLQVLVGSAAELDVHLLNETKSKKAVKTLTLVDISLFWQENNMYFLWQKSSVYEWMNFMNLNILNYFFPLSVSFIYFLLK